MRELLLGDFMAEFDSYPKVDQTPTSNTPFSKIATRPSDVIFDPVISGE
jgi:hypothetical protein